VPARHTQPNVPAGYRPGVCNIGPAEIRRRRMVGHAGLAASVTLLAVLLALDAPDAARWLVAVPTTLAASGYLQAALRFCAGYGARGLQSFEEAGRPSEVGDAASAAADARMARRISLASFVIGLAVGALAFLLPV
jgi:hypothetical protein